MDPNLSTFAIDLEEVDDDEQAESGRRLTAFRQKYLSMRDAFLKCQSPEAVSNFIKDSLRQQPPSSPFTTKELVPPSKVRQIAHSFSSSWELANGIPKFAECPLLKLPPSSSSSTNSGQRNGDCLNEETAMLAINSAFSMALEAEFDRALGITDLLKPFLSTDKNLPVDSLILLADSCIRFDCDFYVNDQVNDELLELISVFSPTEADIRRSLVLARRCNFVQSAKVLEHRLELLKGAKQEAAFTDRHHLVYCAMLYGEMTCAAEIHLQQPSTINLLNSGIDQLRAVIRAAQQSALAGLEAMAKRRLADVMIHTSDLDVAEKLLSETNTQIDNLLAPAMERGLYYLARFSLARKRWKQSRDENVRGEACIYLDRAIKVFHGRFHSLAAKAVKDGAFFGEEMGDKKLRNVCAKIFYTMTPTNKSQQSP